ncbi:MAG TPA: signal peptidase I [Thermoanaerobaculia bacterium]|nr:signal peptidase I [Thermoanaerobaculia bacterium]
MAVADESEKKSTIREYYEALLIAIVFVNFARIFAFQAFKIPSGSMEDNLKIGDHIIVNKCIYGPQVPALRGLVPLRDVERGDVIVFRYPGDPSQDYVKRVVGLPGETIHIRAKKVFINGKPLDEPYVLHTDDRVLHVNHPQSSRDHFGPFVIPQGEYFAMGDNRDNSNDSRFWGGVPRALIKGRAFMVYWSFDMRPARGTSARERLGELGKVVVYFFTKTRWERTFFVVDSRYHYTPGIASYGND